MTRTAALGLLALLCGAATAPAQPDEVPVQYYTGSGRYATPCLVAGDQIGVVFELPANQYPIEITEVDIGWGSMLGLNGQSVEESIRIYAGSVPDSLPPLFAWDLPLLDDGVLNVFDLDPVPGAVPIASGPFVVALEIASGGAGNAYFPTAVHDGYNIQPGRNLVYSPSQGWRDAADAGFTGDWIIRIKYRSLNGVVAHAGPAFLTFDAIPWQETDSVDVHISDAGTDTLRIAGIAGGYASSTVFDTTTTDHEIAPGDSTVMRVIVHANTMAIYTTKIRIHSNAKNSPSVVTVYYAPSIPAGAGRVPEEFRITAVAPNPFNPGTTIHFYLPEAGPVDADIFSVTGSHLRTLSRHRTEAAGPHQLRWDGRDDGGAGVASGIYFLRMRTRLGVRSVRLVLLK